MVNRTGTRIGQYDVLSVIGQGGMATVYKAHQASTGRDVALKVITSQYADDPGFMARFEREARLLARLQHPHILPMYDFGREADQLYLVMRLVEGGSLDKRLKTGAIPFTETLRLIAPIAEALTYAHNEGVVHRDLKPNNILLDKSDSLYLTDFGIAKMVEGNIGLTATGTTVGTPAYMAPEQWRGETVDARTDVYALGVMLYEMLTGTLPFRGDTPYVLMYQHFDQTPPPLIQLANNMPDGVNAIIRRAMAKNPKDRFPSAIALAVALTALGRNWVPDEGTIALGQAAGAVREAGRETAQSETETASALNSTGAAYPRTDPAAAFIERTMPLSVTPIARKFGRRAEILNPSDVRASIRMGRVGRRRLLPILLIGLLVLLVVGLGLYLKLTQHAYQLVATLDGHNETIFAARYNPSGTRILTASGDNTIKIWDVATRKTVYTLSGHTDEIDSAEWSPDGLYIASVSQDQTVRVWNASNGAVVMNVTNSGDLINNPSSVTWRPDGKQLAVGYSGGSIYLLDIASQKFELLTENKQHNVSPEVVAWSPDGTMIAGVAPDHSLEIVDPTSGAILSTVTAGTNDIYAYSWSRDSSRLASASLG